MAIPISGLMYNSYGNILNMFVLSKKTKIICFFLILLFPVVYFLRPKIDSLLHPSGARSRWIQEYQSNYTPSQISNRTLTVYQCESVLKKARSLVSIDIKYNPAYYKIDFPMGDVNRNIGVCADVIIRSFRAIGEDLQLLINEDKKNNFLKYPTIWRQIKTDTNIDHRRVPNLMTYFTRNHVTLPITKNKNDYQPCDIVAWDLYQGITHIGIVSDKKTKNGIPLIIHHIGGSPQEEDVLFEFPWKIIGHYSY
jgi:uncharacterized protein YijF (DUF1287 family)